MAKRPTLDELAAELRKMGEDPARILGLALLGAKVSHGIPDTVTALRRDFRALYAPKVLRALTDAAELARMPGMTWSYDERDTGRRLPTKVVIKSRAREQSLILAAARALSLPVARYRKAERLPAVRETLALAREVALEADRIAEARALEVQPMNLALRHVARDHGTTASALRKRIQLARKAHPSEPWPKKKARRL